jgi:ribosome recycling factor
MTNLVSKTKKEMDKALQHLKSLFKGVSAGKADPELLNTIKVDCYGSRTPINQLGVISVVDFKTLQVQPFDPQISSAIAKALSLSPLNLRVDKAKTSMLVTLPQISGDGRKKLVKHAEGLAEQQKVALRKIRQNARKELKGLDIPKDEKKGLEKKIDTVGKDFVSSLEQLLEAKTKELLSK